MSDKTQRCSYQMQVVEVHAAYMWDCPHCGVENWQRAVTLKMTEEELRESGVPVEEHDKWSVCTAAPCVVTCRECKSRWRTNTTHEEDDHE